VLGCGANDVASAEERLGELAAKLERRLGEQTRWFFAAWATLLMAVIGQWVALIRLR
jgi:hypothetical protein